MTNSGKITRANKSEVAPPSVNKMLSKEQGEVEMLQSMSSCHILLKKCHKTISFISSTIITLKMAMITVKRLLIKNRRLFGRIQQ